MTTLLRLQDRKAAGVPRRELGALIVRLAFAVGMARQAAAQSTCPTSSVRPISPPATPLPNEDSSAAVTRFSFIVYGDTRSSTDGRTLQANHTKVVEAMLETIKARANGPDAIRFVLSTGDAVSDGRIAAQWNNSYVPLVDRLTVGAGVSYYATPGNHDLPAPALGRDGALCNFAAANARLIPPNGSPHRLADSPAYSVAFGNTFVLTFDTTIPDDTAQYFWVRTQLTALDRARYPNVVVFIHQPPISSGPHGGPRVEAATGVLRSSYMSLFREHHVRLVVSGHDHLFEHWVEHYRDVSGVHRLDQIVTGGGGAPAYAYTSEPDLGEYLSMATGEQLRVEHLVKPSPDAQRNPLHFVVINVKGTEMTAEVVGVDRGKGFAPYDGRAVMVMTDPAPASERKP